MKVYCTACSAEKEESSTLLPAIMRYKSKRIQQVYDLSTFDKVGFRIFSGHFGLLAPLAEIPYYDHALTVEEVASMSKIVVEQLRRDHITEILFFGPDVKEYPGWQPYYDALEVACTTTNCNLTIDLLASE